MTPKKNTPKIDASVEKILTAINKHRNEEHLSAGQFERCDRPDCREAVGLLRELHQSVFVFHQMQAENRRQQRMWVITIAASVLVWWFSR